MFYDTYIGYDKAKEGAKGRVGICLEDRVS